ncbi:MAG TPA: FAD-dependent oxidoreductase [Clostridia bacterium]|nr:MAG: putative FAD-binding dehydrogenase [Firmicutes bacterium ADurb.Bin146]HOD92906.1 FAD-dependent oxidoreductase [Clostridia bacterium]HQM39156.1 FAD-dependent oxidoreductase [Clostridia bacterium]
MKHITHKADFCVIGGGLAGICASISAARHGMSVILMHDRPVLGGNASSEIRMHICGADRADGKGLRESGILEEIELENIYHNPQNNYSMWDMVLFSKVKEHKNITCLLNCSCNDAITENNRIVKVKGWQGTSETYHEVYADIFADCSGDSILADLVKAEYMIGRESSNQFNESIEPAIADLKTMGLSCLIQVKKHDKKIKYIPSEYVKKYENMFEFTKLIPYRGRGSIEACTNFWWLELGGVQDSIHDTDKIRDDLVGLAAAVWNFIKNKADYKADNYSLEWMGFLPGKRESRRYTGHYILTQNDIQNNVHFDDAIGYGGWSMDDHNPEGFLYEGKPTIYHPAPQPYEIPYRCLYSRNIENLMFAGRNISASHAAMSSTRVMGTCAILGQAVGTACSIAIKNNTSPRGVYEKHMKQLQDTLMEDDCFIPPFSKNISVKTRKGKYLGEGIGFENLYNGKERNLVGETNQWNGSVLAIEWPKTVHIDKLRIVLDSELERTEKNMPFYYDIDMYDRKMPNRLLKHCTISVKKNDTWTAIHQIKDNHQRLMYLDISDDIEGIKIENIITWGGIEVCNIFSFEAY